MGLSTDEIMYRSLDLVGWDEVPGDSAIHVAGDDLETALVGIDLESPEVQLANRDGFDLALAHHPPGGRSRLEFSQVLDRQVELMTDHSVPHSTAVDAVADLRRQSEHRAHASNYRHDPSIAEYLDQPYMNIHLAPDELGRRAFVDAIDRLPSEATVDDLRAALTDEFIELRVADTDIETRVGDDENEIGTVAVHHAAGTNGGASVAEAYFEHGIDTVVYIHVGASDTETLCETYGEEKNLVITGHIASDAIGMNILIDDLESHGLACTCLSGAGIGRGQRKR